MCRGIAVAKVPLIGQDVVQRIDGGTEVVAVGNTILHRQTGYLDLCAPNVDVTGHQHRVFASKLTGYDQPHRKGSVCGIVVRRILQGRCIAIAEIPFPGGGTTR